MTATQRELIEALQDLAPLRLAADWDNVGVLVEGGSPQRPVQCVLWTIDLTAPVLTEAVEQGAQLIVAYHPPIFSGLKRLRRSVPQERVILEAVAAGITVYSPHTALDACEGGIADWLLTPLGPMSETAPIEPTRIEPAPLVPTPGAPAPALRVVTGAGRLATLAQPRALADLLAPLKAHLGLRHLRVACAAADHSVARVAVCPGAGGSLFERLHSVDLYVTGEMRHHDVLAKVSEGAAVILTEHTNCERGFLPQAADQVSRALNGRVEMRISERDRDPLAIA